MCRMLLMRIKREIKFWDNEHVINGLIGVFMKMFIRFGRHFGCNKKTWHYLSIRQSILNGVIYDGDIKCFAVSFFVCFYIETIRPPASIKFKFIINTKCSRLNAFGRTDMSNFDFVKRWL